MAKVEVTLQNDIVNGGTITVDYREGVSIPDNFGTYVYIDNNRYEQDESEIDVVRGDTSAVITNNTGRTWEANKVLDVQFSEIKRNNIVYLTQAGYDALTVKNPNTEYNIVEV